ncbi:MAG: cytochrome C [Ignavibacteriaceae bacterium]|nr:cytochrome C [Ignavibacteriaceae bacterium]
MKAKNIFYISILILSVSILAFSAFTSKVETAVTKGNVIKFSHALHSELVSCEDCHSTVAKSVSLKDNLLPDKQMCATCHDVEDSDECSTCHYDGVYEKLTKVESGLIYSHAQHAVTPSGKKTECLDCHKGIENADVKFARNSFNPKMETCYTCHGETKLATNACESCHIETASLIPKNHISSNFMLSHKFLATASDANCEMCHNNNSCEDCHTGTTGITEENSKTRFYQPYGTATYVDGVNQQKITKVHGLNYRYFHSIDAKSKSSECYTCHQPETFCSECHASHGGDFALAGMVPNSHTQPNFVTIGRGSGGGQHAILAKRDIERCVSCHDTQGADPACITCHADPDGIKFTNAKTHETGFMKTVNGDWHTDKFSLCYNCHTDSNAKPGGNKNLGFCSYCHN